jgi:hypothetical protein
MSARPRPYRLSDRWIRRNCRCGALREHGQAQCGKCRSRARWTRRRASRREL